MHVEYGRHPTTPSVAGDEREAPLSPAQRGLWFVQQLQPSSFAYNVPLTFTFEGRLDSDRLARCLGEIVRRHAVLRTTFPSVAGTPVQRIHAPRPVRLPLVDMSGLSGPAQRELAALQRRLEAERPFDLERGPLLRLQLLRLAPEQHELLASLHHIVIDGWSLEILCAELAALWNAAGGAAAPGLPALPVQYADYAVWQQEPRRREALARQLAYWRRQLDGVAPLELPAERTQRAQATHPGDEVPVHLRPDLETAPAWARAAGATRFTVLLAAFQWLLGRHTEQEDVAVATLVAGRTQAEVERLIGSFANTLVLRTSLSGAPSLRTLVERLHRTTLDAYANQDLPFDALVAQLNPQRALGRAPLFQVRFVMNYEGSDVLPLQGLRARLATRPVREAKCELTLELRVAAGGAVSGALAYATDLFERGRMQRLAQQYAALVAAALAQPDRPLTQIPLLSPAERRQVLGLWSTPRAARAPEECVQRLFEKQVERAPEATALVHEGRRASYAELDATANRLAHHLRRLGVGPEVRVGIALPRGFDLVPALLGVLKAGGAYVALDPSQPDPRRDRILAQADVRVLITRAAGGAAVPPQVRVVDLDAERAQLEQLPGQAPETDVCPRNLAYIVSTSGSTGRPKAVAVEHRQLAAYVTAVSQAMGCQTGWRFALLSSPSTDLGHTALFPSLCGGGELHVIAPQRALHGRLLGAYFREHAIDCTKITPSHLLGLQPGADLLPARLLVLGGEPSSWAWIDELARLRPGCRILNHYGPSECTVGALTAELTPARRTHAVHVPLGTPLAHARVHVLDRELQPLAPEMAGELCLGGHGVGRGYLGAPDLTAARFVPDPYDEQGGRRLYRTGDRARFLSDGRVEFLGRLDRQIKVRGFRVEPGEIEALLRAQPEVAQCAVVPRADAPGGARLVAYVVSRAPEPAGARPPFPGVLAERLRRELPEYMLPAAWVALDALPRTPNGKLDQAALPPPGASAAPAPRVPPGTALERAIAAAWCDVLGLDQVGLHDNFFDCGGHSLLLVRLHEKLQAGPAPALRLEDLLRFTTVDALARFVGAEGEAPRHARAEDERARRQREALERLKRSRAT